MQSAWLGSGRYQFLSHWFDSTRVQTREVRICRSPKMEGGCSTHSGIASGLKFGKNINKYFNCVQQNLTTSIDRPPAYIDRFIWVPCPCNITPLPKWTFYCRSVDLEMLCCIKF